MTRRSFIQSARAGIEGRFCFEFADGRAVRALHVVGVDFKLRLGVNLCVVREQQVAVGLLGISLLCVLVDNDSSVKYAVRFVGQNAVVKLAAAAMRAGMLHEHVVVQMLASGSDEEAVDQALATFACKNWMNIVTHNRSTQQDGVRCYVGLAGLLNTKRGKAVGPPGFS